MAYAGHLEDADPIAAEVEEALVSVEDPSEVRHITGHIAAIRAYSSDLRGDQASSVVHAREALALLPAGELTVRVALTEDLMPGTLSLPHGYSNSADLEQRTARSGPNSNVLAPADYVDVPSATAALNGIPVHVSPL